MPGFGLSHAANALADLFFPRTCPFCGNPGGLAEDAHLCNSCLDGLQEIVPPFCQKCGTPVMTFAAEGPEFCGRCLVEPPAFNRTRFAVRYDGPLREALKSFKYYDGLHMKPALCSITVQAFHRYFRGEVYDVILPMPIHRRRLIERGFNQAVAIAAGLSQATGIAVDRRTFVKTRDTPHQVGLSRSERIKNLRGSFLVSRPEKIRGKRILLVDDVYTTGSTVAEASKTLAATGPSTLDVLVLAVRVSSWETGRQRDVTEKESILKA